MNSHSDFKKSMTGGVYFYGNFKSYKVMSLRLCLQKVQKHFGLDLEFLVGNC